MKKSKTKKENIYLSILLPVYNEEKSIALQYENIIHSVDLIGIDYEIIFVDDGSTDNSFSIIREIANKDNKVKSISFRKNFGQTAAMAAGIDYSIGEILWWIRP